MPAFFLLLLIAFLLFFVVSFSSGESSKQEKHRHYQKLQREKFREAERQTSDIATSAPPRETTSPSRPE